MNEASFEVKMRVEEGQKKKCNFWLARGEDESFSGRSGLKKKRKFLEKLW